jgi:hypothetical protein
MIANFGIKMGSDGDSLGGMNHFWVIADVHVATARST